MLMRLKDITIVEDFNRFTLFLFAVAVTILVLTEHTMRTDIQNALRWVIKEYGLYRFFLLCIVILFVLHGFICSVYYGTNNTCISKLATSNMLMFGMVTSGFAGISAGYYALKTSIGWLMLLPAFNIMTSVLMILLALNSDMLDKLSIAYIELSIQEMIIYVVITIAIIICGAYSSHRWTMTFSIVIAWATACVYLPKMAKTIWSRLTTG